MCTLVFAPQSPAQSTETLEMVARTRTQSGESSERNVRWNAEDTAIIVCDMWDRHWCPTATARVAEISVRMNEVLNAAREKGILIIHAPSGVTNFYDGTVARERAKNIAPIDMPNPDGWKHLDSEREAPLPIDDSDGGCDTPMPDDQKNKSVWSRQIATIEIDDVDYVTDDGRTVYAILKAEGRENLMVMGVHTNMCVLGRPFAIRANVLNGIDTVLVRDLTDAMYNPQMPPYVSHFEGTRLVIEHIEKFWCPTILSTAIDGRPSFSFEGE